MESVLFQIGKEIGEMRAELNALKGCKCKSGHKQQSQESMETRSIKPGIQLATQEQSVKSNHGTLVVSELDELRLGVKAGIKLDYRWYSWGTRDITPFKMDNIVVTYYADGNVTCEFSITSKSTTTKYAGCGPTGGATWQVTPANSSGAGSPLISYFNFGWVCETNAETRLIRDRFDPRYFSVLGGTALGGIPQFDYCCCSFWGC